MATARRVLNAHQTKVEFEAMAAIWPDPKSEMQSLAVREIAARLLTETDPQAQSKLVEQLRVILEAQLRTHRAN